MTDGLDPTRHVSVESALASLGVVKRTWSPWAVVLVYFQDETGPLPPPDHYRALFTEAGPASTVQRQFDVIDFFTDMSHGKLDLSGTTVFGWHKLPAKSADFVDSNDPQPPGKLNRQGLLDLAKATALTAGVPLSRYAGVLILTFDKGTTTGFLGGMAAICDKNALRPSILGQEMGHGYGLHHARKEGSQKDYQDPWDVMSTDVWPKMEAENREYGTVGPGLNAWNMRSRGWLNEWRVWSPSHPSVSWEQTVTLRPLHHRHETRDWLAADLGPFLVEMRVPGGWDAAIPRACVLVHRFSDNHSYLQTAISGKADMVDGDRFVYRSEFATYELEVNRIDASKTATVHLRCERHQPSLEPPVNLREILGLLEPLGEDGIIIGGHVIKIPSDPAARQLVEQVGRYLATEVTGDVGAANAIRRSALVEIVRSASALYAEANPVTDPPPTQPEESQE